MSCDIFIRAHGGDSTECISLESTKVNDVVFYCCQGQRLAAWLADTIILDSMGYPGTSVHKRQATLLGSRQGNKLTYLNHGLRFRASFVAGVILVVRTGDNNFERVSSVGVFGNTHFVMGSPYYHNFLTGLLSCRCLKDLVKAVDNSCLRFPDIKIHWTACRAQQSDYRLLELKRQIGDILGGGTSNITFDLNVLESYIQEERGQLPSLYSQREIESAVGRVYEKILRDINVKFGPGHWRGDLDTLLAAFSVIEEAGGSPIMSKIRELLQAPQSQHGLTDAGGPFPGGQHPTWELNKYMLGTPVSWR